MRARKITLWIGRRNVGKTTEIVELIEAIKEKVIIHRTTFEKKYVKFPTVTLEQIKLMKSGKYKNDTVEYKQFYQTLFKHVTNACIIGEDAADYLTPTEDKDLTKILTQLRHKGMDLNLIFQDIMAAPRYIIRKCNEIILFKTDDRWEMVKDRFSELKEQEVYEAWKRVNEHPHPRYSERIVINETSMT